MSEICGEFFTFHTKAMGVPAHRAHGTINLLKRDWLSDYAFTLPDIFSHPAAQI